MNKPVIALSMLSLALAASAGYLAIELEAARDALARTTLASATASDLALSKPVFGEAAAALNPATVAAPPPGPAPELTPEERQASWRAMVVAKLPETREVLENAEKRELLIRSWRNGFRQSYPRIGERLGLSDDDYSRLEDLYAQQVWGAMEAQYRCGMKPACDLSNPDPARKEADEAALKALLGPEKLESYNLYIDNIQERRMVEALRVALLDAQPVNDAQAEKLIANLGETRRQYTRELEQRGASASTTWSANGSFVISNTSVGAQQKYDEAAAFMKMQRERAAQLLTADQLKVFTQRADDFLAQNRTGWEYEERYPAKR